MATFACAEATVAPPGAPAGEHLTYHADIEPILDANCMPCHAADGVAPFRLHDYESTKLAGEAVANAVEARRMPPWPASPDCRHYLDERLLNDDAIATIRAWADGGRNEGEPVEDTAAKLTNELPPPTIALRPKDAYAPSTTNPDDYRCFPLEHAFAEESYLVRSVVRPDQNELVHHALVYMVPPAFAHRVPALDADDDGPGYECFAGPLVPGAEVIAAWVPGSTRGAPSKDVAIRIPAGAQLVLQMHYNTLAAAPEPDKSTLEMWFLDEQPSHLLRVRPFAHLGFSIDAGDPDSQQSRRFINTSEEPWTVVAASPHMHLLGASIRMTAEHADGKEACLVDVPRWQFGWQQQYRFLPDEAVVIQPGEAVRLDCVYDNSAGNQPIVDGSRRQPEKITWGEGTLDEMCLGYLMMIQPYAPLPEVGVGCNDFDTCYATCRQNRFGLASGCALQCSSSESDTCSQCVIPAMFQCTINSCPTTAGQVIECLESCTLEGDTNACVSRQCGTMLVAYDQCLKPLADAGECDDWTTVCGASL